MEVRIFNLDNIEFRAPNISGSIGQLYGHAAVFDEWSEDLGGFRERIRPGAFRASIENDDVRALWNHNSDIVLGRNRAQTLTLSEDERGLATAIEIPDTQGGRDAKVSVERGDVNQMSFGFEILSQSVSYASERGEPDEVELTEVKLWEVSPVTFPAYPQTDLAARKMQLRQQFATAIERRFLDCRPDDRQSIDDLRELLASLTTDPGGSGESAPRLDAEPDQTRDRTLRLLRAKLSLMRG